MNRKLVIGVVLLAILAVGGFFGFRRAIREPNADDLEHVAMGMTKR